MTKPKAKPRCWVRTTTVNCSFEGTREWVCDVKPSREKNRWAHRIIVNAPTDKECKRRADIICEALNKGEANA